MNSSAHRCWWWFCKLSWVVWLCRLPFSVKDIAISVAKAFGHLRKLRHAATRGAKTKEDAMCNSSYIVLVWRQSLSELSGNLFLKHNPSILWTLLLGFFPLIQGKSYWWETWLCDWELRLNINVNKMCYFFYSVFFTTRILKVPSAAMYVS